MKVIFEGSRADVIAEVEHFIHTFHRAGVEPKETKPATKRKTTKKAEAPKEPEAPKAGSRRKTAKPPAPADDGDDEINDADLSKAASEAAQVITPGGVQEILDQFGCALRELDQSQRQEFLDLVKTAVEEA